MFGFVVGTVCLIALVRTIQRARWHAYRRSWGGPGSSAGFGAEGNQRGRWMLKFLFRRLDTTAGQEKAVVTAWDRIQMVMQKGREELRQSQRELADLMRQPEVEESAFESMFARQEAVVDSVRKALAESMKEVHGALDDRQRRLLADMIENPWGHAHAHAGHCGHGRHGRWDAAYT